MEIKSLVTHHFVKGEDLNHHGTLFAAREAEWFVEAGLMAAATCLPVENIVCVKVHGIDFKRPVPLGSVVEFVSRPVLAGRTRLVVHVQMNLEGECVSSGFITFVNVDEQGRKLPHGITLEAVSEEDAALQEQARNLPKK